MADKNKDDSIVQVPKALWAYVIKQNGGLDALYGQFYRSQLEGWIARGWSWGKISAKATEAGCGDWLAKQSPASIQGATKPKREVKAKAKKPAGKRPRLSAEELENVKSDLLVDLTKHPDSKLGDIAGRTNLAKLLLQRVLKEMVRAKAVKGVGDKSKRVYTAAEGGKGPARKPAKPAKPSIPADQ